MDFITAMFAIPVLIWGFLWVARGSVVIGCAIYLVVASALGPAFASFDVGVNLSLDRIVLPAIVVALIAQATFFSDKVKRRLSVADWWILGFVAVLVLNTFMHDWRRDAANQVPILQHLTEGYLIPVLLYFAAKRCELTNKTTNVILGIFAVFGLYLAITGICEVTGRWEYVFPRYIANPDLGIHFGRARGPYLQSVRLGLYLLTGLGGTWLLLVHRGCWGRAGRLLGLALSSIFCWAVYATYTRSVWLGLVFSGFMLALMTFPERRRRIVIVGLAACILIGLAVGPGSVTSFDRGIGAEATTESTSMRAVFAYVSWLMFQDSPMTGCGFGHFPHLKDLELGDRQTSLYLESVRGFIHHNTFLSLLVELGICGMLLFLGMFASLIREAIRLWKDRAAPFWMHELSLLFLLMAVTFAIQMLFHEVSYSPVEYGLFFLLAGLMASAAASRRAAVEVVQRQSYFQSHPTQPAIGQLWQAGR